MSSDSGEDPPAFVPPTVQEFPFESHLAAIERHNTPFDDDEEYVQFYIRHPDTPTWHVQFLTIRLKYDNDNGRAMHYEYDPIFRRLEDGHKHEWDIWRKCDLALPPPQIIPPPTRDNYFRAFGHDLLVPLRRLNTQQLNLLKGARSPPPVMSSLSLNMAMVNTSRSSISHPTSAMRQHRAVTRSKPCSHAAEIVVEGANSVGVGIDAEGITSHGASIGNGTTGTVVGTDDMGDSLAVVGIDVEGSSSPNNARFNEYRNPQQMIEDADSDDAMTPVIAQPKPSPPAINIPLLSNTMPPARESPDTISYFQPDPNAESTTATLARYRTNLINGLAESWNTTRNIGSGPLEDPVFTTSTTASFQSILVTYPYIMSAMLMAIFSFTSQQLLAPGLDGGEYYLLASFLQAAFSAYPVTVKLTTEAILTYYSVVEKKTYAFIENTRYSETYQSFHNNIRMWHDPLPIGPANKLTQEDLVCGYVKR